ncbi:tetratricopeptide repeat protein [Campylobacter corcagiensis]|uniref:beta-lactamase n=1 Tax=Campylobacter corcagiensis TaxID=1448857 RepID=A0A7M1LE17_9BACT|nr:sel1 repeat family protein [Campylobacter corcagiensis]QKF65028.1 Sel1 domain-containing protein [Campylobacter corcagiensis]QOQ86819.1 sel1 repeat family protein [Campylobacter corcagiensis]
MKQIFKIILWLFLMLSFGLANEVKYDNTALQDQNLTQYSIKSFLLPYIDCDLKDFEIYINRCVKEKDGEACFASGGCIYTGGVRDLKHKYGNATFDMFSDSCNYSNSKGCLMSAVMLDESDMADEAFSFYQKACKLEPKFCTELGYIYFSKGDYVAALKFHQISCENVNFYACVALGNLQELIFKDEFEASKSYKKTCDNNIKEGCNNLGFYYYRKICKDDKCIKSRDDYDMAVKYLDKGCKLNNIKSCTRLENCLKNYNPTKKL